MGTLAILVTSLKLLFLLGFFFFLSLRIKGDNKFLLFENYKVLCEFELGQMAHHFCWNEFWSPRYNLSKHLTLTQAWHVPYEMGFWNREMALTLSTNKQRGSVLAKDKEEERVFPLGLVVL